MHKDVAVLLLAAGKSRRLPGSVPKPFRRLGGIPLWRHALRTLARNPRVRQAVLAVPPAWLTALRREAARGLPRRVRLAVVPGGRERADSAARSLRAVPERIAWVAVHDAARPFATSALLSRLLRAARRTGAAVPALPIPDTVKRVSRGKVRQTVSREGLVAVQTPQVFRRDLLAVALARRSKRSRWTDDAAAVEGLGRAVRVVRGERWNFKVTTPEDLALARILWKTRSRNARVRSITERSDPPSPGEPGRTQAKKSD